MTGIAWAADAAAPAASGAAMFSQFVPLILIFLVFYFLLIRPQQKKTKDHQNYLANLKRGDKVITGSGIYGQITGLTDNVVTLEIAEGVRIKMLRTAILGAAAEADKTAAPAEKKEGKE